MSRTRVLGLLSLIGGLLGIMLVFVFAENDFGYPGTAAYRTYEALNRLIALPLLLMACGWLGLALTLSSGYGRNGARLAFAAAVIMAAGTAAEFWLFSDQPYGIWTNGRMASFMAFLIASLSLYICATLVGIHLWRSTSVPRPATAILMTTIPLYIATVFTLNSNFLIPAVLALVVGWLLLRSPMRNRVSGGNSVSTP